MARVDLGGTGGRRMVRAIRTKMKKKNNIVILISAENSEELEAIGCNGTL